MNTDKVLSFFKEITKIPRESGHEEQIIDFLKKFAQKRGLECKIDKVGNVLITKPAAKGYETRHTVVLQSHLDMVCEKNKGFEHDFAKDPIKYEIRDGWMVADNTTLGADCGIGIASEMAILDDTSLSLGKIECLFTISEETGMDGAFGLENGFFSGKLLINLDSEDEGELFIGCAGGVDTTAKFFYDACPLEGEKSFMQFAVEGGMGGHSGDDIDKGRANALCLLARFLAKVIDFDDVELCSIEGGNKRNAIPRDCTAVLAFDADSKDDIMSIFNQFAKDISEEYASSDPIIHAVAHDAVWNGDVVNHDVASDIILAMVAVQNGVLAMSADMKGLVETSSNLASVKMMPTESPEYSELYGAQSIIVGSSQRSSVNSAREWAAQRFEATFDLAGALVTHESEYPGWKPKIDSYLLEVSKASYQKLFGVAPIVRAIHAGLECGLFLDRYPDLDMISFGPTIRNVHAPGEKLSLATVDKFWALLLEVLEAV